MKIIPTIISIGIVLVCIRGAAAQPLAIDCTADHPDCPPLVIAGDAPDQSKFHGFADPSMRRDPNTGTLWLAYSWPHLVQPRQRTMGWRKRVLFSRPDVAVDIHLAKSRDRGGTWTYVGPLWQSESVVNPVTREKNFTSHEVSNIWPHNLHGKTIWYGIHMYYLVRPNRFIYSQWGGYSYFALSAASSPEQLADAPSQILGFGGTVKSLAPDVNLASLHPDLERCTVWTEPALITQGETLYLAARCMYRVGRKLVPQKDFYAIFSTQPDGDIKTWQWRYHGKLAGPDEAVELGHQFLTQFDFAQKTDGTVLAIMTPADVGGPQGELYHGSRVLQIASLDPPALARNASGQLVVLAQLTASDLKWGTGASCYEPSAVTGIIMTRKWIKDPMKGYYWMLHQTGLKP